MIRRITLVVLVGGVAGCAPQGGSSAAAPPPLACRYTSQATLPRYVQPTDAFVGKVSYALTEEGLNGARPGGRHALFDDVAGPARDSVRAALLTLAMYPPLRADVLTGIAGREFLGVGGQVMDLVWAAENAPTIDRTKEILGVIPDGTVDAAALEGLRCPATRYLKAFNAGHLGAMESSLGGLAVTYQAILDEIDRVSGRSE